jgi:hypothetical protein
MRRKNVEIRIPARINRALRATAGWAKEHDIAMENLGRGLALCALIVIGGALLVWRLLGRLFHGRRAIVVLGLALAIPVGALAYRFLPDTRATNATGRGMNESVEENARITKWKKNVEQALTEAGAREPARPQNAAPAEDGVDATKASNSVAQEGETTRIDPGAAREPAKKQVETLNASNEEGAAAKTKAASASSVAKEAIATNDAKRADPKGANETKGSESFSDGSPAAGGQEEQTGSPSRLNGWSRRAEIYRATKETDEAEAARRNAIARHAMTYSWVTTDGTGRSWVHTRPIYYSQKD